ncbi:hypothetical protein RD792_006109, partial [Penstemon davidsonii]
NGGLLELDCGGDVVVQRHCSGYDVAGELVGPNPHVYRGWLRNYIGGILIYLHSTVLWSFYIYYLKRNVYVPKGGLHTINLSVRFGLVWFGLVWFGLPFCNFSLNEKKTDITKVIPHKHFTTNYLISDAIPSNRAMVLQIGVAMKAMPFYCALPTLSEYMIENGWTKCFSRIGDVGWMAYLCYLTAYLVFVEFAIYWMHRGLHDIKPLYNYLHATHHIYNNQNTLSPFAGLAFHPLDGILQAVPHVIALFLVPMHFMTHITLIFLEGICTANIHDCIHGKLWPVMGAGYHTIHHTTYRHNYGHYTIWMDWMFGTLRHPVEDNNTKKIM